MNNLKRQINKKGDCLRSIALRLGHLCILSMSLK